MQCVLQNRRSFRNQPPQDLVEVFIRTLIYDVLFIDPIVRCDKDTMSYDHDTECMVSDVLLQYQQ